MDKLWSYLKAKFQLAEKSPTGLPFVHEVVDFENFPHNEYLEWKNGRTHQLMKQRLQQAFFNYTTSGGPMDAAFEFYHTPMSKGFVLFQRKNYRLNQWDYKFFQYYISNLLKENNYILNLADHRSHSKGSWIEKITRFYHKPAAKMRRAPLAAQLFGNVSIEFIMRDDHPYMLRLIANSYQDQNFAPPQPFSELIKLIID